MLGKVLNPFTLSVLAFFPLVAWQGGLPGLTGPAGGGEGKLQRRASAPSVVPSSVWSQPSPVAAGADQLMAAAQPTLQRLQSLGAQYLRIERVNTGSSPYYRCRCELAVGPGQSARQPLEAQGIDPQSAALGVLNQMVPQAVASHLSYQPGQR
ncbi:MAG: hypothetical protein U0795_21145 [Pirellulales bacterium]